MEKLNLLKKKELEYGKCFIGNTEEQKEINYRKRLTQTEKIKVTEEIIQTLYQVEKNEDGGVIDFKVSITNKFIIEALKISILGKLYFKKSLSFGRLNFVDVSEKLESFGLIEILECETDYVEVVKLVDESINDFRRFVDFDINERFLYGITLLSNDFSELLTKVVQVEELKAIELNAQIEAIPKTKEERDKLTDVKNRKGRGVYVDIKDICKHVNSKVDKALIAYGRDVEEIALEVIMRDVYDYYDKIRVGDIEDAYVRTADLLNVRAFHSGKGHVSIRFEGHTPEILSYIRGGSTKWTNSQLYQLSPDRRRRDFIKGTMEELEKRGIVNSISAKLYRYGIRISKITKGGGI